MIPTTTQWEAGYFEELAKQRRASKALTDTLKRVERLQLRVAELERVNRELRDEMAAQERISAGLAEEVQRLKGAETRVVVQVDVPAERLRGTDGVHGQLSKYFDKAVAKQAAAGPSDEEIAEGLGFKHMPRPPLQPLGEDVRGVPAPTVDLHGGGIEPGRD